MLGEICLGSPSRLREGELGPQGAQWPLFRLCSLSGPQVPFPWSGAIAALPRGMARTGQAWRGSLTSFRLACLHTPSALGCHEGQSVGSSGGRGCLVPLMDYRRIPPLFPAAPPAGRCVEGPCVSRKRTEPWSDDRLRPWTVCWCGWVAALTRLVRKQAGFLHWDACLQGQPDEQRIVFFVMESLWIVES